MKPMKTMTARQMRDALANLDEASLDRPVLWCGEDTGGYVSMIEPLEEDQVNPSGDGWEPVSVYADNPDYADEEVVASKGTVVVYVDWPVSVAALANEGTP